MSRVHSRRTGENIEYDLFLIFTDDGGVRLTRGRPDLSRDERALALTVLLPRALFVTPSLRASIKVESADASLPPINITAARDALRGVLGVDIDLQVMEVE